MCWSVFKIVAEASKRRQNTVLTTTAATARASFTANYGDVISCRSGLYNCNFFLLLLGNLNFVNESAENYRLLSTIILCIPVLSARADTIKSAI